MTPREQEVMDRADSGERPADIATKLNLSPEYVSAIIRNYSGGGDNSFHRMSRQGTEALARAIARTGKVWA